MKHVHSLLVIFFLCISLLRPEFTAAKSMEGKAITKKGDFECEYQSYYMHRNGEFFGYNFNRLKLSFSNNLSLRRITDFSVVYRADTTCIKEARFGRTRKVIKGHNYCFSMDFKTEGSHLLCPKNEDFSALYFSLISSLQRFRSLNAADIKAHKKLITFKTNYNNFETSNFRTQDEHKNLVATRQNPAKGELKQNLSFRLISKIGKGGTASVYSCKVLSGTGDQQTEMGDCVAKGAVLGSVGSADLGNDFSLGIVKEAKVLYLLGDNKNIIEMYDAAAYLNGVWLFLDQANADLEELQIKGTKSPAPKYSDPKDLHKIALELLEGLSFMNKNGFYHFDMKPENVMIKVNELLVPTVKIIDFGLTRHRILDTKTSFLGIDQQGGGTPSYFSPERITGKLKECEDERCLELQDSYAAGLTILDALIAPQGEDFIRNRGPSEEKKRENRLHYSDKYEPEPVKEAFRELGLDKLYEVALDMTQEDPGKRITAQEAYLKLKRSQMSFPPLPPTPGGSTTSPGGLTKPTRPLPPTPGTNTQ
ncbi:protein kinase [bacterium]|nr:protein kinase [bacterium]